MSKKIILYIIVEKWIRSANVYATGGGQRGKVLNSIFKSLKFSFSFFVGLGTAPFRSAKLQ